MTDAGPSGESNHLIRDDVPIALHKGGIVKWQLKIQKQRRGPFHPARLWWLSCKAHQKGATRIARLIKLLNFLLYKCILPYEAEIEGDLEILHFAIGVVIHPQTKIGSRCRLHQLVTIAAENAIGSPYKIIIGDDVLIGAGAILIGSESRTLTIGAGAVVGAGAIVTHDVPAGHTVVSPRARSVVS